MGGSWDEVKRIQRYVFTASEPNIVSHNEGDRISGSTETFEWLSLSSVEKWRLRVGTRKGSQDIFDSGSLKSAVSSQTVSGIPIGGQPIWVRLSWFVDGTWSHRDSEYLSLEEPMMTFPVPGKTLPGTTTTFSWMPNGTSVDEWSIAVGTTQGSHNVFQRESISSQVRKFSVHNLPTRGTPIWVRLSWLSNGNWQFSDYKYQTRLVPEINSPEPGSVLGGSTATFKWAAHGTNVTEWWLYAGTKKGSKDILTSGAIASHVLSKTVSNLPTNGEGIWVRLWWKTGNTWQSSDFNFPASSALTTPLPPTIILPVAGSTLSGSRETFMWEANDVNVDSWMLSVGRTPGSSDIFDSGTLSNSISSQDVTGLPEDGSFVWVRLTWRTPGSSKYMDVQYTTVSVSTEPGLTLPVAGSSLSGATATFKWAAHGTNVTEWWLYVGTKKGSKDILTSGAIASHVLSKTVSNLPTNGEGIWVRLWWKTGSTWHHKDFSYVASSIADTVLAPTILSPEQGSTLSGSTATFRWAAQGTTGKEWWLYVGTKKGSKDILTSGAIASHVLSKTVSNLPTNGEGIWVRLWWKTGSTWHHKDFSYVASSTADTVLAPTILSPGQGSTLSGALVNFSWREDKRIGTANGFFHKIERYKNLIRLGVTC